MSRRAPPGSRCSSRGAAGSRGWATAGWADARLLRRAGGLAVGGREGYGVGRSLGQNISAHSRRYPVSWTVEAWQKAGFTDVSARVMSLGGGLVMWGTRADS